MDNKESFMDKMVRETAERMQKELKEQEKMLWDLILQEAKDRKEGKPIIFNGFLKKLTNGQ